jgi:hypothetical protein
MPHVPGGDRGVSVKLDAREPEPFQIISGKIRKFELVIRWRGELELLRRWLIPEHFSPNFSGIVGLAFVDVHDLANRAPEFASERIQEM